MSPLEYDYTIIGTGPAGMASAITASEHGLRVLILDEQPNAGGQIFRNIEGIEKNRNSEFSNLGEWIIEGSHQAKFEVFHPRRFDVPQTA